MWAIKLTSILVFVVAIQTTLIACQTPDEEKNYTNVPLPLLVKKFIVADQATAFSIGQQGETDIVLAAYSKDSQLRVAVTRGCGGGNGAPERGHATFSRISWSAENERIHLN